METVSAGTKYLIPTITAEAAINAIVAPNVLATLVNAPRINVPIRIPITTLIAMTSGVKREEFFVLMFLKVVSYELHATRGSCMLRIFLFIVCLRSLFFTCSL